MHWDFVVLLPVHQVQVRLGTWSVRLTRPWIRDSATTVRAGAAVVLEQVRIRRSMGMSNSPFGSVGGTRCARGDRIWTVGMRRAIGKEVKPAGRILSSDFDSRIHGYCFTRPDTVGESDNL